MESVFAGRVPVVTDGRRSLFSVWWEVLRLTARRPGLLVPFLSLAFFEYYALLVVGETPPPFDAVLNPPIAFFFGARFTQYPAKIAILPSLFSNARIVVDILIGSLLLAWAVKRIAGLTGNVPRIRLWTSLATVAPRYLSLMGIALVTFLVTRLGSKAVSLLAGLRFGDQLLLPASVGFPLFLLATFAVVTLIEGAMIYAVPALVTEDVSLWRSLVRSVAFARERPWRTLILVAVPALPYFFISFIAAAAPVLFGFRSLDKIANVFLISIGVAFVARYLMVLPATVLYLSERPERTETE